MHLCKFSRSLVASWHLTVLRLAGFFYQEKSLLFGAASIFAPPDFTVTISILYNDTFSLGVSFRGSTQWFLHPFPCPNGLIRFLAEGIIRLCSDQLVPTFTEQQIRGIPCPSVHLIASPHLYFSIDKYQEHPSSFSSDLLVPILVFVILNLSAMNSDHDPPSVVPSASTHQRETMMSPILDLDVPGHEHMDLDNTPHDDCIVPSSSEGMMSSPPQTSAPSDMRPVSPEIRALPWIKSGRVGITIISKNIHKYLPTQSDSSTTNSSIIDVERVSVSDLASSLSSLHVSLPHSSPNHFLAQLLTEHEVPTSREEIVPHDTSSVLHLGDVLAAARVNSTVQEVSDYPHNQQLYCSDVLPTSDVLADSSMKSDNDPTETPDPRPILTEDHTDPSTDDLPIYGPPDDILQRLLDGLVSPDELNFLESTTTIYFAPSSDPAPPLTTETEIVQGETEHFHLSVIGPPAANSTMILQDAGEDSSVFSQPSQCFRSDPGEEELAQSTPPRPLPSQDTVMESEGTQEEVPIHSTPIHHDSEPLPDIDDDDMDTDAPPQRDHTSPPPAEHPSQSRAEDMNSTINSTTSLNTSGVKRKRQDRSPSPTTSSPPHTQGGKKGKNNTSSTSPHKGEKEKSSSPGSADDHSASPNAHDQSENNTSPGGLLADIYAAVAKAKGVPNSGPQVRPESRLDIPTEKTCFRS